MSASGLSDFCGGLSDPEALGVFEAILLSQCYGVEIEVVKMENERKGMWPI